LGPAGRRLRPLASAEVTGFSLRAARDGDGQALAELSAAVADTGAIRVAPHFLHDPLEVMRALRPDAEWVLAETDGGLVIGAGLVDFDDVEIEGDVYRAAHLSSLMVHADYRRRGVAKALTAWRLERAGKDAVVVAAIQSGNEGSFANARKWATQIFGTMLVPAFKAASAPAPNGLELREPREDAEWEGVAAGLDEFERGWNLRVPQSAHQIRTRLARSPLPEPVQRQIVAVEGDRVVGGCELHETGRLQTLVLEHVPFVLRALDVVGRVLPPDRVLRPVVLSRLWHAPGRADIGHALWAFGRSEAAKTGNSIGTQLDPRGPLAQFVPVRPWTPKGKLAVAVRSPVRLPEEALLAPA
jgi:GNAT superfamily N-acetyltransferase